MPIAHLQFAAGELRSAPWARFLLTFLQFLCTARNRSLLSPCPNVRPGTCHLGKNKHYQMADVQRQHFNSTVVRCFLLTDAEDVIERVLARPVGAIDALAARLPVGFPQRLADTIFARIVRNAKLLEMCEELHAERVASPSCRE